MDKLLDLKALIAAASLAVALVSALIGLNVNIGKAQVQIVSVQEDITDIRETQIASANRIEKLYDAFVALKLADK